MNSKLTTIVLGLLLVGSLAFSYYSYSQLSHMAIEVDTWEKKYEEALIDMEEAFKRLEEKDTELKAALKLAEEQKAVAEDALQELQKQKARK
jgi:hypothetical protein